MSSITAPRGRTILLLDNGSLRAEATRNLRRLASGLGERIGEPIHPVSLLHSNQIPATELDGVPAEAFAPFLRHRLQGGDREFLVIPLFFGPSRALTQLIPEQVAVIGNPIGPFSLRVAEPLCPLPGGEPRLARILLDNLAHAAARAGQAPHRAVLVDHGSPIPEVTAVRRWLAAELRSALGPTTRLDEAVMERRDGPSYDFNGERLEQVLTRLALQEPSEPIFIAQLFLAPGRHAGPGGDIDRIRRAVEQDHPGLRTIPTDLVGSHPGLIDILAERIRTAI